MGKTKINGHNEHNGPNKGTNKGNKALILLSYYLWLLYVTMLRFEPCVCGGGGDGEDVGVEFDYLACYDNFHDDV